MERMEKDILSLMMLEGLAYLHSFRICHRDIKPSNIMVKRRVDGGWQLKLIDVEAEEHTITDREQGTRPYIPPEMLLPRRHETEEETERRKQERTEGRMKGDMYSLGLVLSQLWFETPEPYVPTQADPLPPSLRAVITQCLASDWPDRPTALQALELVRRAEREWREIGGV